MRSASSSVSLVGDHPCDTAQEAWDGRFSKPRELGRIGFETSTSRCLGLSAARVKSGARPHVTGGQAAAGRFS